MRLKIFSAPTIAEAMRQIRDELGDEAVIVQTHAGDDGTGVEVTAALENGEATDELDALLSTSNRNILDETLAPALRYHGVSERSAAGLLDAAEASGADDPATALVGGLKQSFQFRALNLKTINRPIMLIGPPGAGKTLTAAKLATRAILGRRRVKVITTDSFRAGAEAQIAAYTDILQADLETIESPRDLKAAMDGRDEQAIHVIDTAGTNPFSAEETRALARLIDLETVEPILVLPASGDIDEAREMAAIFQALGVERLIATRLDISRRLGAMVEAAIAGGFAFADVSISAHVARGLKSLTAQSFARLLLRVPQDGKAGAPRP